MTRWNEIWDGRPVPPSGGSVMARLMAGGGLDSGFAQIDEEPWIEAARRNADRLGLSAGTSVFEVGCGAGAFLYGLWQRGHQVAGIDRSASLVEVASEVMPGGHFAVGDAADVDITESADAVISNGVFLYFPSHDYAAAVIARMALKARSAVAVLDIPDAAKHAEAIAYREGAAGGREAYQARYAGLAHRYYDRHWMHETMTRVGLVDVQVADQDICGYGNTPFRFNAWGFVQSPAQAPDPGRRASAQQAATPSPIGTR